MTDRERGRLQMFLYILGRDHLPTGAVDLIIANHVAPFHDREKLFSNGHLAALAEEWIELIVGHE